MQTVYTKSGSYIAFFSGRGRGAIAFNKALLLTLVLPMLMMLTACGAQPVYEALGRPIHAQSDVPEEHIGKMIQEAGEILGWKFKPGGANELIGSMSFRGGAHASVSVTYSKTQYEIRYKDSLDLRYNGKSIHGSYNNMVRRLDNAIRIKLDSM